MRLVWAQYALDDRDAISTYIENENPKAAVHVDEEIARAVRRLLDFPESGRPGRIEGTREFVSPRTPYSSATSRHNINACFAARGSTSFKSLALSNAIRPRRTSDGAAATEPNLGRYLPASFNGPGRARREGGQTALSSSGFNQRLW